MHAQAPEKYKVSKNTERERERLNIIVFYHFIRRSRDSRYLPVKILFNFTIPHSSHSVSLSIRIILGCVSHALWRSIEAARQKYRREQVDRDSAISGG